MGIQSHAEKYNNFSFAVLEHHDGNGGCLVVNPGEISRTGPLVYFNADGRIRDAVTHPVAHGGSVIQDVHSIGSHGCRAILRDSEGNRIALHSNTDA